MIDHPEPLSRTASAEELYLDLLKRSLTGLTLPAEHIPFVPRSRPLRSVAARMVPLLDRWGVKLVREVETDLAARIEGRDWPPQAVTMIGLQRLDNLEHCIRAVVADGVEGDLIETGVWRGGAVIFMLGALRALGDVERTVWAADSFQGLPPPDTRSFPADEGDTHHTFDSLRVSVADVERNITRFGLDSSRVRFLEGWFRNTLPSAPIEKLSIARLDGDMYESTIQALEALHPKIQPGGFVIIDDYGLAGCKRAVDDFRAAEGIVDELHRIDWIGAYWRRSA